MKRPFRVALGSDFARADGSLAWGDIGLSLLDASPGVERYFLAGANQELRPDQLQHCDALLITGVPLVTARALERADHLTIVARFGVGYDHVDLDACTRLGIMVTITPDGVRRPMAAAALAFILALAHQLLIKDRLTRAGRWSDKLDHIGIGLTGRVLGLVGLGNIARDLIRLVEPFGMKLLAHDPYATPAQAVALGVELVDLDRLLRTADVVCILCPLMADTYHLINAERLALMKPTAYLVNVARGPIVDQAALTRALQAAQIQGAALDVFEQEPVDPGDPILQLENVIVAPHGIGVTDEICLGNGRSACRSILEVAAGRIPPYIVNTAVRENPLLHRKLDHYRT
jgi:phosphoglycerate dehydrogenase-like enzyme